MPDSIGGKAWRIWIQRNMLEGGHHDLGGDGWMTQVALGQFVAMSEMTFSSGASRLPVAGRLRRVGERRGAAGVVAGEAGIGKTALLHSLERRSEAPVRWLRGMEAEAVLPFAAAADLLTPLRPYFPAVPPSQRRAMEVALALADGAPPSTLAICAGALGVLAAAGDDSPLLVFVDDLQWIDAESRQLLLFAARRLVTERVGILFTLREGASEDSVVHDLPVLRPGGADAGRVRGTSPAEEPAHPASGTAGAGPGDRREPAGRDRDAGAPECVPDRPAGRRGGRGRPPGSAGLAEGAPRAARTHA